jgi:RND family efflux transporter MFP subunit
MYTRILDRQLCNKKIRGAVLSFVKGVRQMGLAAVFVIVLCSAGHAEPLNARVLFVPEREAVLSSEMAGRIVSLPYREGQSFKKGAALADFDCSLQQAHLKEAKANLRGVEADLENKKELAALQSTGNLEVVLLEARRDAAAAQLNIAAINVRRCRVYAPFSGKVVETLTHRYESVNAGTPLLSVLDDSSLRLELVVPSAWLGWLKVGQKFDVQVDETGTWVRAEVQHIAAGIDAVSQTLKLYATVKASTTRLVAGMSGMATFKPGEVAQ